MKLKVPFYKQTTELNCGPVALRMALAYLGKDEGIKILEEKTGIKEGKGISTIQIAIAAASLKYKTEFYSKHVLFNQENLKHEYYQKYSDMNLEQSQKWVKDAEKSGVKIKEKTFCLEEILKFVTKDSIPIILLDWNVIKSKKGYQGHFVPIIGFDKKNVWIHDHGFEDNHESISIPRETFDKARKAEGTDEDIIVIYRK
jgi:hypothetical protein